MKLREVAGQASPRGYPNGVAAGPIWIPLGAKLIEEGLPPYAAPIDVFDDLKAAVAAELGPDDPTNYGCPGS
jgi:hypothetical protein